MLRGKLAQLLTDQKLQLSGDEFNKVARAIVAYSIGIVEADELRKVSKELNIREEIQKLKNDFLDSSNYITSKFWRAMFAWAKGKSPERAAKEFEVTEQDIWFAIDMLSQQQLKILEKKIKVAKYVEHPCEINLNKIIEDLRGVAYKVTRHKLRFIYKNDTGTSEDDLAMELIAEGIRVINIYDYDNDYKKIRNFAIRAMKNHSIRLIEWHTAKCRQRLVRTRVGGISGDAAAELAKLQAKGKTNPLTVGEQQRMQELVAQGSTVSEFATTTLSIHYQMGDGFTLESLIEDDETKRADKLLMESNFISTAIRLAPSPIRKVLEIVLGKKDDHFDLWMSDNKASSDSMHDSELLEQACAFYKVDKGDIQRHISGVMKMA